MFGGSRGRRIALALVALLGGIASAHLNFQLHRADNDKNRTEHAERYGKKTEGSNNNGKNLQNPSDDSSLTPGDIKQSQRAHDKTGPSNPEETEQNNAWEYVLDKAGAIWRRVLVIISSFWNFILNKPDVVTSVCTIALALFALWAAVLLRGTLKATRKAEKWTRHGMVQATMTNIVTEEMSKAQTRAYVGFKEGIPEINWVNIVIVNSGTSPAYDVRVRGAFIATSLLILKQGFATYEEAFGSHEPSTMFPNQERKICINKKITPEINGRHYPSANGDWGYLTGQIVYRDIFGRENTTNFRYHIVRTLGGAELRLCEHGNDANYDEFTKQPSETKENLNIAESFD